MQVKQRRSSLCFVRSTVVKEAAETSAVEQHAQVPRPQWAAADAWQAWRTETSRERPWCTSLHHWWRNEHIRGTAHPFRQQPSHCLQSENWLRDETSRDTTSCVWFSLPTAAAWQQKANRRRHAKKLLLRTPRGNTRNKQLTDMQNTSLTTATKLMSSFLFFGLCFVNQRWQAFPPLLHLLRPSTAKAGRGYTREVELNSISQVAAGTQGLKPQVLSEGVY